MMKCTNCFSLFNHTEKEHIEVWHRGQIVTLVCPLCIENAARARITLKRNYSDAEFQYMQYVTVETFKEESNERENSQRRTGSNLRNKKGSSKL